MKKVAQKLSTLDKQIYELGFESPGAFILALSEFGDNQNAVEDDTLEKLITDFFEAKGFFHTEKDDIKDLVKERWGYEVKSIRKVKNVFKVSVLIDGNVSQIEAKKEKHGYNFTANGFPI